VNCDDPLLCVFSHALSETSHLAGSEDVPTRLSQSFAYLPAK
jgi:hypothetical protein